MKTITSTLFLFVMLCASSIAQKAEIWQKIENCFDALHEYDAESFVVNFSDDATLIAPFGTIMRGKQDILETHKKVFQKWGNAPEEVLEKQSNKALEYLTPDLAFVSFINETKGDPARGVGEVSYSVLLKEVGGEWLIHAVQMTPVQPIQK